MTLTVPDITRIATEVAQAQNSSLQILGVSSSDGGSNRIEILVRVRGCHNEPCTVQLNISRGGRSEFEQELRDQLRRALASHGPPAPAP